MERKLPEGTVPTVLGTAVTIVGVALIPVTPLIASGVAGFGLVNAIIGGIDMYQNRKRR
ncbi:MAG: asparagine synthase [Deltaproteobacteria bacterium]